MNRREFLVTTPMACGGATVGVQSRTLGSLDLAGWPTQEQVERYAAEVAAAEESKSQRPLLRHVRVVSRDIEMADPRPRQNRCGGGCISQNTPPFFGYFGNYMDAVRWSGRDDYSQISPNQVREWWRGIVSNLVARRYDQIEWAVWRFLAGGHTTVLGQPLLRPHRLLDNPWCLPELPPNFVLDPLAYLGPFVIQNKDGSRPYFGAGSVAYAGRDVCDAACRQLGIPTTKRGYQERLDAALSRRYAERGTDSEGVRLVCYDRGYLNNKWQFEPFLPPGRMVFFKSVERSVVEYRMCRIDLRDAPGRVSPQTWLIETEKGPAIQDAHTGGPVLLHPRDVWVLDALPPR